MKDYEFANADVFAFAKCGREGFVLTWNCSLGFGEITFSKVPSGRRFTVDTECMSPEFVKAALTYWVDTQCDLH